jgi:predicted naringenin-chalcone synthase
VIGEALKASEGPQEWLDLLQSISSLFAYAEGTPPVKGAAPRNVVTKHVKAEVRRLQMGARLRRFRDALEVIGRTRTTTSRYFLLDLDPAAESLQITNYREGEIEAATDAYVKVEREALEGRRRDIVLVRANSVEALTRAYPNYFLDTELFLKMVEELTS